MNRRAYPLAVLGLVALAFPLACGKKQTWPGPSASGSVSLGGSADPSSDGGAPLASAPASGSSLPVASGSAPASASASGSSSATPTGSTSAVVVDLMDAAAEAGLKALAAKAAPGMVPDGPPIKAELKEGDHAVALVTLQPNKCYVIVGHSPTGGVKDLDVKLLAPPFFTMSAGEDKTADNNPVVGKPPLCPALPLPLAYKVDVFAKKGAGRAMAQVYSKMK